MKHGPIIWGGPIPHRLKFHEHDVVYCEGFNRHGTIVSGVLHAGTYGIPSAVYVEFKSGEGLPGNDRVQTVCLHQLRLPFRPGDVVIIHSDIGIRNRFGELGILSKPAWKRADAWEVETADGSLSTYESKSLEVIDHGIDPTDFSVSYEVVKEIAMVQKAIKERNKK